MICMIWKLIRNEKKWNFCIVGLFSILCVVIFLVNDIFFSAKSNILEENQKKYGKHHGIFFDVNPKDIMNESKEGVEKEGWICLTGTYHSEDLEAKITVGYFDQKAREIDKIKILDGRMPEEKNEIAVEQSKLKKFGKDVSIGDQVVLKNAEGEKEKYKICGIVNDYSTSWEIPDYVKIGKTTLPEVFISEKFGNPEVYHYMFQMKWSKFDYDSSLIWELAERLGINTKDVVLNQKTYVEGMDLIKGLNVIQNMFMIVLSLAIIVLEFCLLPIYYEKYAKSYDTFWLYGMDSKRLLISKFFHYLLVVLMIMIQSTVLFFTLSKFIEKIWIHYYAYDVSVWLIALIFLFFVVGGYVFIILQ